MFGPYFYGPGYAEYTVFGGFNYPLAGQAPENAGILYSPGTASFPAAPNWNVTPNAFGGVWNYLFGNLYNGNPMDDYLPPTSFGSFSTAGQQGGNLDYGNMIGFLENLTGILKEMQGDSPE